MLNDRAHRYRLDYFGKRALDHVIYGLGDETADTVWWILSSVFGVYAPMARIKRRMKNAERRRCAVCSVTGGHEDLWHESFVDSLISEGEHHEC